jgi:hypothetical protein
MIEQRGLQLHHVAHGDLGEAAAPGLAVLGMRLDRSAGPVAAGQHVAADDEIPPGSSAVPGPIMPFHQTSASAEPVKAWQTSTALPPSGDSRPQVR